MKELTDYHKIAHGVINRIFTTTEGARLCCTNFVYGKVKHIQYRHQFYTGDGTVYTRLPPNDLLRNDDKVYAIDEEFNLIAFDPSTKCNRLAGRAAIHRKAERVAS